jgi:3-hydroxyacyl-[acyl-carrier-protein] dehydratase
MNPEYRGVIPAEHPSLVGHFPGNPVVPGVVILDEVVQALAAWQPGSHGIGMPVVKFLAPLRPEQVFIIRFVESGARGIRFECIRDDGQLLVQGCMTVARGGG